MKDRRNHSHLRHAIALLAAGAVLSSTALAAKGPSAKGCQQSRVYVSGAGGYHTYRIPSLIVTAKGTVLAFCEGRKTSAGDSGDIDLLLRRSTDNGETWGPRQIVWDDGGNTCGNPCPVIDSSTGTIWLLLSWNHGDDKGRNISRQDGRDTRRAFVTSSTDDGATWAKPKEITTDVKKSEWTWFATGPGNGIQLTRSAHRGRLVIPCNHGEAGPRRKFSYVIYSDDHGATWRRGGACSHDGTNESTVVELADGRLMLNMRNHKAGGVGRGVCFSSDGGLTWDGYYRDATLVEPVCQGSILRYCWPDEDNSPGRIVFSNPATLDRRDHMTVRLSEDDGKTWPAAKCLHKGPAAYSCLAVLPDGRLGCLYEAGKKRPYETIRLARFTIDWLKTP